MRTDRSESEIIRLITQFMRELRGNWVDDNPSPPEAGHFYLPYRNKGKAIDLPLGWIGTRGCSWTRKGGCTMCDYGGYRRTSNADEVRRQIENLFKTWNYPEIVNISALGSIFDPIEVPPNARNAFFSTLSKMPNLQYVGVESRAEYINEDVLAEAKRLLGSIELDVGIGLESTDDTVRNVLLNKGMSLKTYERAVRCLLAHEVLPVAHVFLKPPLLTEREAINDAIQTIRYAVDLGVHRTVLMASNLKANTLTWWLHKNGEYELPSLWSVMEIIDALDDDCLETLQIYGFECGMPMEKLSGACPCCNPHLIKLISEFNYNGQRSVVDEARKIKCSCRQQIMHDPIGSGPILKQRIQALANRIEVAMHPEINLRQEVS